MKATRYILLALSITMLFACNSSGDKKVAQELKKKEKLRVPPNQRITCDTLDASFYLPSMFAFSVADTLCVNRAKYFVYEFKHNTDSALNMQITLINDPGKYDSPGNLPKELGLLFAAYPDKKNNYGYMDTINEIPFVHVLERAGTKNRDAEMVYSWILNRYFSLKITNSSFRKGDTAYYQRLKDSILSSITLQRAQIEAPAPIAQDTPAAPAPTQQ